MTSTQVSFRGMPPSEAATARIHERVERLSALYGGGLHSCHVVVQAPHQHRRHGRLFHVSIQLRYPGGEVDIHSDGARDPAHEDLYVALRDRFDAAERQLESRLRRQDHGRPPRSASTSPG